LFTGTEDEKHFYITSAWIELRGVEALSVMRRILDETFVSDALAIRRITNYLNRLAKVIRDITQLIDDVRAKCRPDVFYHRIRPWFHGATAHANGLGWHFDGIDLTDEEKRAWGGNSLGGPSAGQSSLIHALDVFLGVDHSTSHPRGQAVDPHLSSVLPPTAMPSNPSPPSVTPAALRPYSSQDTAFLQRMQTYMPRHHRLFLQYLGTIQRPVRAFVKAHDHLRDVEISLSPLGPRGLGTPHPSPIPSLSSFGIPASTSNVAAIEKESTERPSESAVENALTKSYNNAVEELKRFRDVHIRIVTLFIISPSRRIVTSSASATPYHSAEQFAVSSPATCMFARQCSTIGATKNFNHEALTREETIQKTENPGLVGTGGTQLVPFLKGARDNTLRTLLR
jgi:indoleamine 2,3-dioxygenase